MDIEHKAEVLHDEKIPPMTENEMETAKAENLADMIELERYSYTFNGRKNEYGEYVIRCYKDGKRYADGDYHTNDKNDALQTLEIMRN